MSLGLYRLSSKNIAGPFVRCFGTQTNKFYTKDLKIEDTDTIMDFFNKYFLPGELFQALRFTPAKTAPIGDLWVPKFVKDPISFGMYSQDNELVGLKLNEILDLNEEIYEPEVDVGLEMRQVIALVHHFEGDLPRLVPDVKRWMYFFIGCVKPELYRQGLATRMWMQSLEIAKEYKCEGALAFAVSAGAQEGLGKLGFECVKEEKYRDYVDPITEQKIFTGVKEPESLKLIVKTW